MVNGMIIDAKDNVGVVIEPVKKAVRLYILIVIKMSLK